MSSSKSSTDCDVVGARLKQAREARRLTVAELARAAGLHATEIEMAELGTRTVVDDDKAKALAVVLRCSADWLCGRRDDPGAAESP